MMAVLQLIDLERAARRPMRRLGLRLRCGPRLRLVLVRSDGGVDDGLLPLAVLLVAVAGDGLRDGIFPFIRLRLGMLIGLLSLPRALRTALQN